jgi:hypothetical protein
MLKKTSSKTLSVLLTLLITLPLVTLVMPIIQVAPVVEASSSADITLDVSEGYVGDYVTVMGRGFTPDKDVTFMWGEQLFSSLGFITNMPRYQRPSIERVSTGEVHTDALGNFFVQLQVPKLTRGTYTIKASDTVTSATATFTIKARMLLRNQYAYLKHGKIETPEEYASSQFYIDLFLAEGFVGDELALQLSGFGNGEVVEVKIGTTKIGDFTVGSGTDEGYLFDTSAVGRIPQMPSGDYTVNATGSLSGITALATFKVKPELFLARQATPPSYSLAFPWIYSSDSFGLGWYSSVGTAVDSQFMFEATGLTGTAIQSVNLTFTGGSFTCTLSGTLAISSTGSTQGINASTAPFTTTSPFGVNSPVANISEALTSGTVLSVVITTSGAEGATFTFPNQLFASSASTSETAGSLIWVEGEGTITNSGSHLSDTVDNKDELVGTGLKAGTTFSVRTIYPSGTTVLKTDEDALFGDTLIWIDQATQPLCYYDANGNSTWDVGEDVYQDIDNSGNVTAGDMRINTVLVGGNTYWPWSTVAGTDADFGRTLIKFETAKRPAINTGWYDTVYLDYDGDGEVSAGDVRISFDRELSFVSLSADSNGFLAATLTIPERPGGGKEYNVGLWNFVADGGVQAGNSVTMQIQAFLDLSTPTRHQSTLYVTEASSVTVSGKGFLGNEPVNVFVAGEYITQLTPSIWGVLDGTSITMPATVGGAQSITAQGIFTTGNNASATVKFTSALSVSPTSGYNLNPVTSIMVTGKGFEAGTYQIVLDGAGVGEAVTSAFTVADTGDEAGQINIAFNLPEGVEGAHIVDVVKTSDPTKSAVYGASYFTTGADYRGGVSSFYPYPTDSEFPGVTIYPSLQVAPKTTTVGTSVTVTGGGLQPNTTYYIWYDLRGTSTSQAVLMTTTPTTVATDAEGTLTASFQVPQSSGGTRRIWVSTSPTYIDNDPVTGGTVYTSISIQPALVLTPSSGTVGTTVSVSVSGLQAGVQYQLWWYKPEEPLIAGYIAPAAVPLATITGATYGNATETVSFNVPATAEVGAVYAVDLSYFAGGTILYSVLPTPSFFTVGNVSTRITLSLTPTTVTQGENVTINGFIEPAMSVNITLYITAPDGISTNKTVTSTSSGTFTDTFRPNKAGTWQVIAKWDGNAVYAAYTSLAATVTVKPIDVSWAYTLTGLIIGIVALVLGLTITLHYMRKRRDAPPAA